MKKAAIYILVLIFLQAFAFSGQPLLADDFPDISNHWAKDYISTLSLTGYVNGYPDKTFKPDKTVTQAEFLTVLILCMGASPSDTTTNYFNDTSNHWARGYINEAVKRGILIPAEYSNILQPDSGLKRSQLAAMVIRALNREPDYGALSFTDNALVEQSDYRGYIKVAYDLNLLAGYPGGEFKPFEYVTRAQMCKVLCDFMEVNGSAPVDEDDNSRIVNSQIKTIAIGDELYPLTGGSLYFKVNLDNIRISSISTNGDYITVNSNYRFFLNSTQNNPDIVVNNNRYGISKMLINGDKLVIYPSYRKIESFSQGNYTYYSDYVKLYINTTYTQKYLSDMEIIDEYTVEIDDKTYDLSKDKVTIGLGEKFYDITKISLGMTETTLRTEITDPVIVYGIDINDISAIFANDKLLDLNKIKTIEFIVDGKRYGLANVTLDASGNFIINQDIFAPEEVDMIVDDTCYVIDLFKIYNGKYIFYCAQSEQSYWVRLNNLYIDADRLKILKDNVAYDIDQVLVVDRNIIRIKNKQYVIDSTFKCLYNNDVYDIDRIDYDTTLDCVVIIGDETTDSYWANQPSEYIFYNNNTWYQDGATEDTSIYADRQWLTFEQIMISDPAHFTYDGESYDLIGALIRIGTVDFEVVDTAWRGQSRELHLYMEEI
ncbi:MAG: S-layer homology domain-containing protein [Syntrophomonadaceae bacterium]|jgi:hypothetical protein